MTNKKEYFDILAPKFLSWEFVKEYINLEPPFGVLGSVVYLRTYSRYIPELKRRESWWETVLRVVEYSLSLYNYKYVSPEIKNPELVKEGQELYDAMFNLKVFPSGRTLWVGGTKIVKEDATSNYNCAFTTIKDLKAFKDTFHLLLLGCLPPNTLINTEYGLKTIKDIEVGDKVWSFNKSKDLKELQSVTHKHNVYVPKEEQIKITSKYGSFTTSTKHPILVYTQGNWNYVPAATIKVGDIVQKYYMTNDDLEFNDKAYFAGAFLGDGSSNLTPCGSRRVRLTKSSKEVVEKVASILENQLTNNKKVEVKLSNNPAYSINVWMFEKTFNNKEKIFYDWSCLVGDLPSSKTKYICIPNWIKQSNNASIFFSFLAGLVDTDGSVSENKVQISTSSKQMVDDLLNYLPLFGIYPWSHTTEVDSYTSQGFKPTSPMYKVCFSAFDMKSSAKFLAHPLKKERIENYVDKNSNKCLIIPDDLIEQEIQYLNLIGEKKNRQYHFKKQLEKANTIEVGYYTSRNKSFKHLLHYDVVLNIETELDLDENFLDITVEHNHNYYCGEGSYYNLHNCGVGFSVESKYISQLPNFNTALEIEHKEYDPLPNLAREESTQIYKYNNQIIIEIGDSRLGWENALEQFLFAFTQNDIDKVTLVYDSVRPAGERLKSMGGRASGYKPLQEMFRGIEEVIKSSDGRISSVQAMDISNLIARAVIVGGVRRSSQIALGDVTDHSFITAKENLWTDPAKAKYTSTRVMSNNSVMLWNKPSKEHLYQMFNAVKNNGEPAIVNAEACSKRRPNFKGGNPCFEILLDDKGTCNLTEVNVLAFVKGVNNFDYKGFYKALELATRMGSRITNVKFWDKDWTFVQERDRLLGVSLTGQVEAWDKLGWGSTTNPNLKHKIKYAFHKLAYFFDNHSGRVSIPPSPEQFHKYYYFKDAKIVNLLKDAKSIVHHVANIYHQEMGIPSSLLISTCKPSGTLSQLPTVSSGAHRAYSPYYLRRIRVSNSDPVAQALYNLSIPCVPENGQGDDLHSELCNTWVFSFPVKTNAPISSIDERAVDQLERYKQLMQYYVDHNVSFTCSVAPHEWNEVVEWLYKEDNWNNFCGISFLPRFDSSNSPYPNMPYQSITKDEYDKAISEFPQYTEKQLVDLINQFEVEEEEYDLGSDCQGGCPVK